MLKSDGLAFLGGGEATLHLFLLEVMCNEVKSVAVNFSRKVPVVSSVTRKFLEKD